MKKIVSVLSALLCVFGLSVMSFARTVYSPSDFAFLDMVGDHYKVNEVIPVSTFSSSQIDFWKKFMGVCTGSDPDSATMIPLVLAFPATDIRPSFVIALIKGDYNYGSAPDRLQTVVSGSVSFMKISHRTSDSGWFVSEYFNKNYIPFNSDAILWGSGRLSNLPDSVPICNLSRIEFEDDLGSQEPDPPPDPSPSEPSESIPDTPKPPPYNPTIPTIPQGGQYVPYDTSIWNTFLERIKANMGSATNIGFLIFGVSVVWAILIRVVKRFTKAD